MIAGGGQALELALATWRAPAFVEAARRRPLPEGMELLLRLAASDAELAERGARASGETPEVVSEAAAFFLQQVLFAPDADSYRVLGVAPEAPTELIKRHYRLLMRWLHPDRHAGDAWESLYADRVNRAWQNLRHPDKRAEYDRQRAAQAWETEADDAAPPMPAPSLRFAWDDTPIAATGHRRLPALVLGGLALISALTLALMWYARTPQPPRPPTKAVATAAPSGSDPTAPLGSDPAGPNPSVPFEVAEEKPGSDPEGSDPRDPGVDFRAVEEKPGSDPVGPGPMVAMVADPMVADSMVARSAEASAAAAPLGSTSLGSTSLESDPSGSDPGAAFDVAEGKPGPDPEGPDPKEPMPDTPPLSETDAHAMLSAFTTAYAAGDLPALLALFTGDARNNRGGIEAIAFDYQSLFERTEQRAIELQPTAWISHGENGTVLARYRAEVRAPGQRRPSRSEGEIRFDLRRVGSGVRISQVRHGVD